MFYPGPSITCPIRWQVSSDNQTSWLREPQRSIALTYTSPSELAFSEISGNPTSEAFNTIVIPKLNAFNEINDFDNKKSEDFANTKGQL
jgi:hypothetical protein